MMDWIVGGGISRSAVYIKYMKYMCVLERVLYLWAQRAKLEVVQH